MEFINANEDLASQQAIHYQYFPIVKKLPKKCNDKKWLPNYLKLHQNMIEAAEIYPRFLVLRPFSECGLANRLKSIRAAFFLAVVSRRAFFIDWGFMYKQPAKNEGLDPNLFDWRKRSFDDAVGKYEQKLNCTLTSMDLCQRPYGRYRCDGPNSSTSVQSFFSRSKTLKDIFQPNIQILYVMMWNVDHYGEMWANPDFAAEAQRIGIHRQEFFIPWWNKCSFRILFQPEKNLAAAFCNKAQVWMSQRMPLVSVHVRTNDKKDINIKEEEKYLERFVMCARGIANAFTDFLNDTAIESLLPTLIKFDPGFWVIGADKERIISHMRRMAPNVTVYSNSPETRLHTRFHKTKSADASPFLDLLMLSHAPFGIGTMYSSFTQLGW
eukprot:CAMPEP_0117763244 /NCGR_PEP_ID=MMETSP0947-20121206/18511_1 /TAXON_ID=44440 /ORGANISM="Chattonella subsalsa, Strain CCMP2191" /LENGTH=380 /DNA_ID=CAMNT_0005584891 /DNA_START=229 /DNA_END=1368 /DNA_ORIENTATION=+